MVILCVKRYTAARRIINTDPCLRQEIQKMKSIHRQVYSIRPFVFFSAALNKSETIKKLYSNPMCKQTMGAIHCTIQN